MFFWSQTTSARFKNSIEIRISSQGIIHSCMHIEVKKKKLIQQLTQSPLAFVNWAASRHAQVHKMGSFLRQKMSTINH